MRIKNELYVVARVEGSAKVNKHGVKLTFGKKRETPGKSPAGYVL
jgi:hypothetical protein